MSKVYFYPIEEYNEEKLSIVARQLIEKIIEEEKIVLDKKIPLKVHFGEHGNETFIKPGCYDGIIDYLQQRDIETSFIETNVLYRGKRTTRQSHIEVAKEHGFNRLPILIADGDHGEDYHLIPIDGEHFDGVKIGKAFADYNQFIVLAHFKGHEQAGFGGALKQLAMGFAARGGKLDQHATISPFVKAKKCISCGICLEACDYDAIEMDEKAFILDDKCVGCAACVAACPVGAIGTEWSEHNFTLKLAEYAYGAAKGKSNIYVNFVHNITEYCDCYGAKMDLIAENIGVLVSKDPVALDKACLDMLQEREGKKLFDSGRESLIHAEKLGLGSQEYDIIPY